MVRPRSCRSEEKVRRSSVEVHSRWGRLRTRRESRRRNRDDQRTTILFWREGVTLAVVQGRGAGVVVADPEGAAGGAGEAPGILQIGVERRRHTLNVGDEVRLFVMLRLCYDREQEKRKSKDKKRLPRPTYGQHLRILPKRDFRSETRPKCSRTSLRPAGPTRIGCKLATNRHNICSGSFGLRTGDLRCQTSNGEDPTPKNRIWNHIGIPISGDIYSNIRMRPKTEAARRGEDWLGGAKDNQTRFALDAQAYWSADRAEAAIHVNIRHGRRSRGEERGPDRQRGGSVSNMPTLGGRAGERTAGR